MAWFRKDRSPAADPDPVGPVGGYLAARGPANATGYPGSGPGAPSALTYHPSISTPISEQAAIMQQNDPGQEFYGGMLPNGPTAAYLPVQIPRERRWYPRVSTNTEIAPQRNTTYYGGELALPNGADRYTYGGSRSYAFDRPIPLTRNHLRVKPGASGMDGTRYYAINQGKGANGAIGQSRSTLGNRPTVFEEPAPWTANFYDTTGSTGAPGTPGSARPVRQVYVSPNVQTNTNGGTWRRGG